MLGVGKDDWQHLLVVYENGCIAAWYVCSRTCFQTFSSLPSCRMETHRRQTGHAVPELMVLCMHDFCVMVYCIWAVQWFGLFKQPAAQTDVLTPRSHWSRNLEHSWNRTLSLYLDLEQAQSHWLSYYVLSRIQAISFDVIVIELI